MQSKPLFYIALLTLMLIGAWGILHISNKGSDRWQAMIEAEPEQSIYESNSSTFESSLSTNIESSKLLPADQSGTQSNYDSILELINDGQALAASSAINDRYSSLSVNELESLKSALLKLAFQPNNNDSSRTKNVLLAATKAFDDLAIWKYLGDAAVSDNDWNTAFKAYFRASELENNPIDLEQLLVNLVASSGHLRSNLEANGDLLSVKNLYQRLSDLHPNFQRFQYELAISNLKLGETQNAKQLLQPLIYDPELGEASKQTLARITSLAEQENQRSTNKNVIAQKPKTANLPSNDIVVPLISAGSSFIVDTQIERQSARLLLDTGASITSLSSQLIERLNLQATGQSIRLSTANGLTQARIYKVKQLRLGSLVLRDMLIAEINLSNNRSFQGLLGTDALNQLKPQYNYLIDNQQRALIFRKQ